MTYLGYLFNVSSGSVTLQMSREKLQRYKRRIELTFSSYSKRSRTNEGKARKLLKKRLRFLTGNTRLVNNKKNVMSGVFFSNPLLSNVQDLKALDSFLSSKILTVTNIRLKKRLESFSFEYGFLTKQFHKFSAKEISEIVEVWKNAS